ncbi:class I SAM-dependent methyltransferase [Pseudomonas sp. N040]|uniref:class I SAM-dependent methyltransferase n=1 Tax=Pseudomonas sp. N040 TaxID=2785325 RepID=UPI0018A2AAF8|nr:class I SAM-dependent methyltransferase [Pseudomonas sp. N040]MBF7730514.1 class I SAM-dependent methyltransferase [Pseudomonas sp. N040]MBW7014158.1 class I SAM-dependent methyltransferase [Pseudomonas sp. N040]
MAKNIKYFLNRFKWWDFWGDHFNSENLRMKGRPVLEIGAGPVKREGVTTLDFNPSVSPDILHDLDILPWPISDSCFDAVYMFSVIEHVSNPLRVIEECHRILKPNGKLFLLTPHFSSTSSYTDLSHKWHFSSQSFDYFVNGTPIHADYGFYSKSRFKIDKKIISLHGVFNFFPFLQWLANKNINFWEDYFCFIIRGAGIYIELRRDGK